MKQEWSKPSITDLSVLQTESNFASSSDHDGVYYDLKDYNDKIEGHS